MSLTSHSTVWASAASPVKRRVEKADFQESARLSGTAIPTATAGSGCRGRGPLGPRALDVRRAGQGPRASAQPGLWAPTFLLAIHPDSGLQLPPSRADPAEPFVKRTQLRPQLARSIPGVEQSLGLRREGRRQEEAGGKESRGGKETGRAAPSLTEAGLEESRSQNRMRTECAVVPRSSGRRPRGRACYPARR